MVVELPPVSLEGCKYLLLYSVQSLSDCLAGKGGVTMNAVWDILTMLKLPLNATLKDNYFY